MPKRLPRVAGDRDRVGQVLMNLVSNAIKYSPEGGDVTIAARRNRDVVTVSVTDHLFDCIGERTIRSLYGDHLQRVSFQQLRQPAQLVGVVPIHPITQPDRLLG
ncbi:MAG: ATP-binding protein, partial [Nocardioides sp.]